MSNPATIQAIRNSLSISRIKTYDQAVVCTGDASPESLVLYDWNAQVSAAFMASLHICEVVIRNAVSDALTAVYGDRWPWEAVFEQSLPAPHKGYKPRLDLQNARRNQLATGKVIPELKFAFWHKLFTSRHDVRLWDAHLRRVLPQLNSTDSVIVLRAQIYAKIEQVRRLRNRVAHHEPIFRRDLGGDLNTIADLIRLRSPEASEWMMANQWVTLLLQRR